MGLSARIWAVLVMVCAEAEATALLVWAPSWGRRRSARRIKIPGRHGGSSRPEFPRESWIPEASLRKTRGASGLRPLSVCLRCRIGFCFLLVFDKQTACRNRNVCCGPVFAGSHVSEARAAAILSENEPPCQVFAHRGGSVNRSVPGPRGWPRIGDLTGNFFPAPFARDRRLPRKIQDANDVSILRRA